jgi:hypothetical protein
MADEKGAAQRDEPQDQYGDSKVPSDLSVCPVVRG